MKYNPKKHHRRSLRLKGYDYSSAGAYFITICTYERKCLFGEVVNGVMQLNEFGQVVADEWLKSTEIRCEIELEEWVVMPNHIHGIVFIRPVEPPNGIGAGRSHDVGAGRSHDVGAGRSHDVGAGRSHDVGAGRSHDVGENGRSPLQRVIPPMKPRSISSFIAGFKSATTKYLNIMRNTPRIPIWQRNYYEHIIRNEASLQRIRQYIQTNPLSWNRDKLHHDNPSK